MTASIEDYLAAQSPEMRLLAIKLQSVIKSVAPELLEHFYMGSNISYGSGEKMSEQAIYIAAQKNHVNLGFYLGTELPDPSHLLEGTGKKLRHIKIRDVDDADRPELHLLIRAAADHRSR